jgi:hypothetical protein
MGNPFSAALPSTPAGGDLNLACERFAARRAKAVSEEQIGFANLRRAGRSEGTAKMPQAFLNRAPL